MKKISALIVISTLLIGTTNSIAAYLERGSKDILMTEKVATRAAAYQAGVDKLAVLKAASPIELSNELNIMSRHIDKSTVTLNDDAYVTVQERMGTAGEIVYIGVVNVGISYLENDDDN